MMRILGIGRLRRVARRLRNRFRPGVLILLYHRVAELSSDPYLLSVTPQHFAEHLEILRQQGAVMRLQQLTQALRDGNLPDRGVVVTFDDGYADNLYNAKPLLERYDIPATVFVTSGHIGQEREFWWDELDRLLLQPGTLPETLDLISIPNRDLDFHAASVLHQFTVMSANESTDRWELGEAAYYSEDDRERDRCWHLYQKDDPSTRQRLFRSLYQLLNYLPQTERWKVLDELSAWARAESKGRSTHRTLSPDEVVHLAEGELVEVGAHTVTHPVLSALPMAAQRDEIRQSKVDLEEILGRPVTSFAYPHGSRSDYTVQTVTVTQETGFACACSAFAGVVGRNTDRFQMPRVVVNDCDGEIFARRLEEWFLA